MSATYYGESEFNGDVTFHRGVRFYGKVSGVSYARHLQSKDISDINIGAIPYQSTLGDEPITSFINSGANGYFLKSNGPGTAPSWAEVAAPVVAIPSGSVMIFYQAAAPTGWTKQTTHNDKSLRVVSGTGGGSGGSTAFTSVFTSRTPAGSVSVSGSNSGGSISGTVTMNNAAHTLTISEIPAHTHTKGAQYPGSGPEQNQSGGPEDRTDFNIDTGSTGGGGSHTHANTASFSGSLTNPTWSGSGSFTGTAMDFAVQYIDVIICSRD